MRYQAALHPVKLILTLFNNFVQILEIQSNYIIISEDGSVPEWLKGTDCKSVGFAYIGSNPIRPKVSIFVLVHSQNSIQYSIEKYFYKKGFYMINWQVIGQLFSATLIVLSGPIVILLISLKKGNL